MNQIDRCLEKNTTINSSPHGQNGRHFTGDIFVNVKFPILIKISLFVPKGPIDNNPAYSATSHYLNQCWPNPLMHICGTSGRWVKQLSWLLTDFLFVGDLIGFVIVIKRDRFPLTSRRRSAPTLRAASSATTAATCTCTGTTECPSNLYACSI